MSPVEPRPEVMGTTAVPSIVVLDGLCFLPKMPAFTSGGANKPPLRAPRAARKERRFQANFKFIRSFLSTFVAKLFVAGRARRIDDQRAADDLNERIARNPFDGHAGARG